MMEYNKQSWEDRLKGLGDEAEAKFEAIYPNGFVRSGLNRPPLQVWKLPVRERYRPDYMTSSEYVEVQGFGKKQVMALKVEKYNALQFWNQVHPVRLFIYDSHLDRYTFVSLRDVDDWINSGKAFLRYFPEGKAYFQIAADTIFAKKEAQDA